MWYPVSPSATIQVTIPPGLYCHTSKIERGHSEPEQFRRVCGGTTAAEMLKDVLERKQTQLKQAENQQQRAVNKSRGQIIGEMCGDVEGDELMPNRRLKNSSRVDVSVQTNCSR